MNTRRLTWRLAFVLWIGASLCLAGIDWQDRWHTEGLERLYFVKLWLYWFQWGSGLAAAYLLYMLVSGFRSYSVLNLSILVCSIVSILIAVWAGQIEPHLLSVRFHNVPIQARSDLDRPIKVAIVSDLHWGLFVREHQIRRIANTLRELDADFVLIAGDFTYEPKRDLKQGFSAFRSMGKPIFAVLGNHDVQAPGPKLQDELRAALKYNGIQLIEGESRSIRGWRIVGLDDLWGGHPREQISQQFSLSSPRHSPTLLLTHQPDTIALLPANSVDVAVAGHTHGGQIRLPYLTDRVLKRTMSSNWYEGLYNTPAGQLWVTSGTGMIGLPFRFRVPPSIDVLTIQPNTASDLRRQNTQPP